jgi:hypothetical protein
MVIILSVSIVAYATFEWPGPTHGPHYFHPAVKKQAGGTVSCSARHRALKVQRFLRIVAANLQLNQSFSVRLDGTNVNWYVGTNVLTLNNIQVQ